MGDDGNDYDLNDIINGFKELAEKYKPIMRKFGKRRSKKKRNKY